MLKLEEIIDAAEGREIKRGSMRFPVVATRCRGMVLGTELWKADGVSLLVDC